MEIIELFKESTEWIKANYARFGFVVERDFVWTVQKHLSNAIIEKGLPFVVFNDYPIEKGINRSKSVDLAVIGKGITHTDILNGNASAEFVAEFKFEPSKKRPDICTHKLPVVFWSEAVEDIHRIKRFTEKGAAKAGIAILVDEYGRFRKGCYSTDHYSEWLDWGSYNTDIFNVSLLWTRYGETACHIR